MNKSVQLAVLTSALLSQGAMAEVIYGKDNRKEVHEASRFEQKLASSAATMISEKEITEDTTRPGIAQLNQRTLRIWLESQLESKRAQKLFSKEVISEAKSGVTFCKGEEFVDQPNPGSCSGFLVAPDLIMTAGHCAEIPTFCSEYRWVFDFKVDRKTDKAGLDIKQEDIYKCKKVVSNALNLSLGLDYAIVQLDRVVTGREPLELRTAGTVPDKTSLVVIGSPSGLPLKVAGGANVRDNSHPTHFSANLDTFQGNSGSAVFNAKTGVVEGILVRGETDFVPDVKNKCIEANKCKNDKCRGEDISRLTSIPEVAVQETLYKAAMADDEETIEKILKLNIWVDFYGKDGQSALMKAAIAGKTKSMKLLIEKGADINLKDATGNTATTLALKNKQDLAAKLLTEAGAK